MGKDKTYYKLLHEHGRLASDTIRVSSDSIDGTPYLTIDFSDCTEHKQFTVDRNELEKWIGMLDAE